MERTAEEAAPQLPRAQSCSLLLRTCGLGRLTHLARLLPPAATDAFAAAADNAVLEAFQNIAQLDGLSPTQRRQARVSLRLLLSTQERDERALEERTLFSRERLPAGVHAGFHDLREHDDLALNGDRLSLYSLILLKARC